MPKSKKKKAKKAKPAKPSKKAKSTKKSKPSKTAKKKDRTSNKNPKGVDHQVKHIGKICAIFAIFQALVLIGLCLTGIICTFISCGENTVAVSFKHVYLDFNAKCPMTIVKPVAFFIFCILYILLCLLWIIFSAKMLKALKVWKDVPSVKKAAKSWTIMTIIILVIDVLIYLLFLIDFYLIAKNPECPTTFFFSGFEDLVPPPRTRKTTIATTTQIPTVETDDYSNPFVIDNSRDRNFWSKQFKSKYKNLSDSANLPFDIQFRNPFRSTLRRLNQAATAVTPVSVLPAMVGLLVAIKGIFAWMADVILLAVFRIKLATLTEPKQKKNLKYYLAKWFKKKPKPKPKKSGKKTKKKPEKIPCKCGKKLPKPKRKTKPKEKCK